MLVQERARRSNAGNRMQELLARGDVEAGRVVMVGEAQPSRIGYWLVAPLPQWRQKKVQALIDALSA